MPNFAACFRVSGYVSIFASILLAGSVLTPSTASAQVVERGVQGGIVGAIIGGLVGGGRGAGRGAAIGAGVGIIAGAAEANARARRAYDRQYYGPPPPVSGNLVYDTQAQLTQLGYDPGPVDGVYGQRTADAISQYQYYNQLPSDGQPSPQLLDHMVRHGG
jgi:uncharacterized protein YcfJ